MDACGAKEGIKETVRERLGYGNEYSDEEVESVIDDCILESPELRLLPVTEKRRIGKEVFDSLRRLDILQSFIENRDVTDGTRKIEIPIYAVEWLKMGLP